MCVTTSNLSWFLGSASCCACITKVQVPPYATLVFVSLFITPFKLHVSALLIGHLQVWSTSKYTKEPLNSTDPLIRSFWRWPISKAETCSVTGVIKSETKTRVAYGGTWTLVIYLDLITQIIVGEKYRLLYHAACGLTVSLKKYSDDFGITKCGKSGSGSCHSLFFLKSL
jgi:hypothetical protein